jgi:hypothetical protein
MIGIIGGHPGETTDGNGASGCSQDAGDGFCRPPGTANLSPQPLQGRVVLMATTPP